MTLNSSSTRRATSLLESDRPAESRRAYAPGCNGTVKLSIVIPVYNEFASLEPMLQEVMAVELPNVEKEIILVDDGSTDGTRELLTGLDGESGIHVYLHTKNRGKGAALRTGFGKATGDIVLIQDASTIRKTTPRF